MPLEPSKGIGSFLLRSLVPALVYLVITRIDDVVRGGQEITWVGLVTAFLGGLFLAWVMGMIASRLPWRVGPRVLVLWLFLIVVQGVNLWLEWYFFSTEGLNAIARWALVQAASSLVLAWVIAAMFPGRDPSLSLTGSLKSLLAQRRWYSWLGRVVGGTLTYVLVYFVFGAIAFQYTRPYYTDPAYGLNLTLPDASLVFPLQVVRGFIFVLVVFFVVSGLRLAKGKQALLVGMGLFILGGLTPLVAAEVWPVALRFYHTVEIFFQNFTAGAVLAYLLGVSAERMAGTETH